MKTMNLFAHLCHLLLSKHFWIMCTKDIRGQVSIDILDQPSIDTRWTPANVSWYSIDTQSSSWQTVGRQVTKFWSIHMSWLPLSRLSTNCWSSVDGVSTKYWSGCQLSMEQDVNGEYWMRVLMNDQLWMPLHIFHTVHISLFFFHMVC